MVARGRIRRTLLVMGVSALVLASCGDSDDTATDTTVAADPAAFCDAYVEAQKQVMLAETPAGDPEAMQAAVAAAQEVVPDEIADDLQTMVDALSEGETEDEGATTTTTQSGAEAEEEAAEEEAEEEEESGTSEDDFAAAETAVNAWLADNCDFESLSASGVDFAYEDLAADATAGVTTLEFTNDGTEFHEMIVIRPADGVTQSVEEILALPEEQSMTMITILGGVSPIPPGQSAKALADLSEPGEYTFICFLPEGSTPEAFAEAETTGNEPQGPPHFTKGMIQTVKVT